MQLRHLKTFVAVASTLNITRAAERVHLSQSSVTEQLQGLESDLGCALFDRSGRTLKLTEAGALMLGYAHELLALADEAKAAVSDVAGQVGGRLAIGGLETLCAARLPTQVAEFRRLHPQVQLQVQSANSAALRNGVKDGTLDVAFVFGDPAVEPTTQKEQVAQEPFAVIVPAAHALASRRQVSVADLAQDAFVATEPGCVYRQMLEACFQAQGGGRPRIACEVGSISAIRGLVESGIGVAIVPRLALPDDAPAGAAIVLSLASEPNATPVTMLWRKRRVLPPALQQFLQLVRRA